MPVGEKHKLRFGPFQLDTQFGQVSKDGIVLKLQGQPVQILEILLEKPGELVTREELRQRLWPSDTFVDFDHSLNTGIKKLRQALSDEADTPRYIQTLPKRGYRFIAPVDGSRAPVAEPEQPVPVLRTAVAAPAKRSYAKTAGLTLGMVALAAVIVLIILAVGHWRDRLTGRTTAPPRIESLAVLPLANLSGDPQQDYFADSMTDALISQVGQVGSLRVISRTSVMQYKGTQKPLPQIARELNVDALVEGSVLRSGDRIRVTAQLIGAVPERHLWARSYDRDLRDVLTLESEVARDIAEKVNAKVTPGVQARLSRARPVNPEAHELFLKGVAVFSSDAKGLKKAREYFQQAIQKDPNFAQPYLGVAWTYFTLEDSNQMASNEAVPIAEQYARKALEVDDSLADAHAALAASLEVGDWNWSGAEAEFKRAFEVNPNSDSAHGEYSLYLLFMGRMEEAIAEAKRDQELSPGLPGPYNRLGFAYYFDRRYDEALAQFKTADEKAPNCCKAWHSLMRGWVYREKGMYKESFVELQKWNMPVSRLGHLGNAYARAGKKAEARKAIQDLLEFTKQGLGTWEVALVYAGLGEKDQAFDWLERAYKTHDKGMCYLKIDPPLDPLRSDPRYQDLVRRMNFPQ